MKPTIWGSSTRRTRSVVSSACWLLALAFPLQGHAGDEQRGQGKVAPEPARPYRIVSTLAWRPVDDLTAALLSPDGILVLTGACNVNHGASAIPPSTREELRSPRVEISWLPELALWDAATGEQLRVFHGHRAPVRVLAFHPNGRLVASGGAEDYVAVQRFKELPRDLPTRDTGRDLGARPTGGVVKVWDVATGRSLHSLSLPARSGPIAFSPDGQLLEAFSYDYGIMAWQLSTGEVSLNLKLGDRKIVNGERPRFCVDAQHLMLTTKRALLLGRTEEGRSRERFLPIKTKLPVENLWAIAVSPDGRRFVTGTQQGELRVWDFKTGELLGSARIHAADGQTDLGNPNAPRLLTFDRDGSRFLWGTVGGIVEVWNASDCRRLRSIEGPRGRVVAATFLGDRIRVLSGGFQRKPFDRDPVTRVYRREPLVVWEAEIGTAAANP